MKKFKFSMQKLLEYNVHMEDLEKNVLGEMRAQHRELCGKREKLYQKYRQCQRDFAQKIAGGVDIREIMIFNQYLGELQQQIKLLLLTINQYQKAIDQQIDKLVGISREKRSIEKLKDNHFSIYEQKQRKEDELFIEEFVANASFSRIHA